MKKTLLLILSLVLVAALTVTGTMAYLTSKAEVNNTFTVGKVNITMDETDTDEYGVAIPGAERVPGNEYKLIPGHHYIKDPVIHVNPQSEPCYIFIYVDNQIEPLVDGERTFLGGTNIDVQLQAEGWESVAMLTNGWVYGKPVNDPSKVNDFVTFKYVDIKPEVSDEVLATYEGKTITVYAYAVQQDGFIGEEHPLQVAWNATFGAAP